MFARIEERTSEKKESRRTTTGQAGKLEGDGTVQLDPKIEVKWWRCTFSTNAFTPTLGTCQCTANKAAGGDDSPQLGQGGIAALDGLGSAGGLMRHVAGCHAATQSCAIGAKDYGDEVARMRSLVVAMLVVKRDRESATVERQTALFRWRSASRRVGALARDLEISSPVEKFRGRGLGTPAPLPFEPCVQLRPRDFLHLA